MVSSGKSRIETLCSSLPTSSLQVALTSFVFIAEFLLDCLTPSPQLSYMCIELRMWITTRWGMPVTSHPLGCWDRNGSDQARQKKSRGSVSGQLASEGEKAEIPPASQLPPLAYQWLNHLLISTYCRYELLRFLSSLVFGTSPVSYRRLNLNLLCASFL